MIREVEDFGDYSEITYVFNDMNDFIEYMEEIKDSSSSISPIDCHSKSTIKKFHDCKNWGSFLESLKNGSPNYTIDENIFKTDTYERKFEVKKDYFGSPDVPKTLMGLPKNYHRVRKTKETFHYPIFIGIAESAFVNKDSIKEYRIKLFNKINYLISQSNQVAISLFGRFYFERLNIYFNVIIDIKTAKNNPDMDKLMFFCCSSDILRRGVFRIMETDSLLFSKNIHYGYGRPLTSKVDEIEDYFNAILIHPLSVFEAKIEKAMDDIEERLINKYNRRR